MTAASLPAPYLINVLRLIHPLPPPMKALRGFVGSRPSASSDCQPSTSSVFPGLRKLDLPMDESHESPLLTLTLSSPSFLDTVVKDEFSDGPLYITETHRDRTAIYRCETENITSVAKVQWPSRSKMISASAVALSGISVQMHGGRWRPAEEFLKFGSLFTYVPTHSPRVALPFPPFPCCRVSRRTVCSFTVPASFMSRITLTVSSGNGPGGRTQFVADFFTLAAHWSYSVRCFSPHHSVYLFVHQRSPGDPPTCKHISASASASIFLAVTRRRYDPESTQLRRSPTRTAGLPRCDLLDSGDRH